MGAAPLHREVERRLVEHDVRYTRGRRAVVDALADSPGPRSAAELVVTMDDPVPLSSLYRTLSVLEESDVVVPHLATKGIARYELAEWLTGHHHHFICTSCGAVEDIELTPTDEEAVDSLVDRIAERAGYVPTNHELEIAGLCKECA